MAGLTCAALIVAATSALAIGCDRGEHAPASTAPPAAKPAPNAPPPPPNAGAPTAAPPAPPAGMVLVPATEFFMGVAPGDHGMEPGRSVKVDSFFIDKLEVTAAQYKSCVATGGCAELESKQDGCTAARPALASHPVNCVEWYQADRYCRAQGKRLPTDAEWELAARGSDRRNYPWGNAEPADQLCRQGRTRKPSARTCEVGSFPEGASPFGVLDAAGNVAEWTATEASGSVGHSYLVKGGSYLVDEMEDPAWRDVRVDKWVPMNTASREVWLGFRCAKDAAAGH